MKTEKFKTPDNTSMTDVIITDVIPDPGRRRFLASAGKTAVGLGVLTSSGALFSPSAWAKDALDSHESQTLLQMARDVYPHDNVEDKYYARVITPMGDRANNDPKVKSLLKDGAAELDRLSRKLYKKTYLALKKETERVEVLKEIETSPFFQKIRGAVVMGIYNNEDLWPMFGFGGSSWEKGGYINRGFDDIDWL